jgi:hypothetical protein
LGWINSLYFKELRIRGPSKVSLRNKTMDGYEVDGLVIRFFRRDEDDKRYIILNPLIKQMIVETYFIIC